MGDSDIESLLGQSPACLSAAILVVEQNKASFAEPCVAVKDGFAGENVSISKAYRASGFA